MKFIKVPWRIGITSLFIVIFALVPAFLFGQPSEKENLNRVIQALNGIPGNEERFLLADYGGFGSSLLVRNPGTSEDPDKAQGTFVLAVPLYADFALDTALAMADLLSYRNNSVNILIAFLGDERNELPVDMGGIAHKGLRDLLSLADMPENWVLCYLDADETPGEIAILYGRRGYVAPLDIVKPLPFLFKSRGIPWSFLIRYNEIYKLGLVEGPEVLLIAWNEEINGFVMSGADNPERNETVLPRELADLLLDYAETLSFPVLNPDRHYSSFILPNGDVFFLSEGYTAVLLLLAVGILFSLFLIYSARYNAILFLNFRLFTRSLWVFLILFPFLIVSIKISAFLYSRLLLLFGAPLGTANFAGAGLAVALAILVFFLSTPVLDIIRFPRRERFYGISAVMFVTIGLFSAAFLFFSYVPVFIWGFVFIFLGALLRNPILVFSCVLLLPVFPVAAMFNVFETGSNRITELLIFSGWRSTGDWGAAFQIALLFLPLFLLAKRGMVLLKKRNRRVLELKPRRKYRLPIFISALLLAMPLQILLMKHQNPPEPRFHAEIYNDEILNVSLEDINFQDSRIISLRAEARGRPVRFDVFLESNSSSSLLPVYSATVPFERDAEGRKISFFLGEFPPNPLSMEIVVSQNFNASLSITAIFNDWDPAVDPFGKPDFKDYILRVSQSIDLSTN